MQSNIFIQRPQLLRQVLQYRDTAQIKVLTGFRRSGKSTLLRMVQEQLLNDGVPASHIFVRNFDSFDLPLNYDVQALYLDLQRFFEQNENANLDGYPSYIFLDEVQEVEGWERVVRKLESRAHTDVYITGSNSKLLSGELSTYLSGRYTEIPVYPLSFEEYYPELSRRGLTKEQAFSFYMRFGGMPSLAVLGENISEHTARDILGAIYDSVIIKDVAQRFNLRDTALLEKLSRYILSTTGNLFSTNKITQVLRAEGVDTSYSAVDNHIRALKQAFVFYEAEQENLRGKELLRPQRKFYAVDNGLRNLMHDFASIDLGAQLEGIVFMELLRRGYQVHVGKVNTEEIDFIADRGPQRQYIQVTLSMVEESVRQRELRPLRKLRDAFARIVITLDSYSSGITEDGIRIVNAVDWLLATSIDATGDNPR